jgi:hypothetical protein
MLSVFKKRKEGSKVCFFEEGIEGYGWDWGTHTNRRALSLGEFLKESRVLVAFVVRPSLIGLESVNEGIFCKNARRISMISWLNCKLGFLVRRKRIVSIEAGLSLTLRSHCELGEDSNKDSEGGDPKFYLVK